MDFFDCLLKLFTNITQQKLFFLSQNVIIKHIRIRVNAVELEKLMNTYYDELNTSDKQILKTILANRLLLAQASCDEVAQACHVSRATLLRVCRKISLQSFSELKYLLKENDVEQHTHIDFHNVCESYHLMIQDLNKISFTQICEKLYHADTIYIYGTGNEQKSIAQEFKRIFLTVEKCVIDLFDYGEIALMKDGFQKDDVFIIISLSGGNKEGIEVMKDMSSHIHTLSITRLQNNTISSLCEMNVYAATQRLDNKQYVSYEMVGIFYALLDMLFMKYLEYKKKIEHGGEGNEV